MANEQIKVCDVKGCPRKGKSVDRIRIEMPRAVFACDLCKEHAEPLREFITQFPSHFTVKVRPGFRGQGIEIHTMEEIDLIKEGGELDE